MIYYGTANPGTWNHNQRPGDNLWSSTIFARNPDNGHARWAYQANPHDLWDYDEINENVLVDNLPIGGSARKVLEFIQAATVLCMLSTARPERSYLPIRTMT